MKDLSVKVKVLSIIIALSVISLGIFGYLTFQSYKKDKLAFIYDHLSSQTQAKAKLLSTTITNFDLFLGSIISGLDFKTRELAPSHLRYLQQQEQVLGLYFHIPNKEKLHQVNLYQTLLAAENITWKAMITAPFGLSLVKAEGGYFLLKKPLSAENAFAVIVFKQGELTELFNEGEGRNNFIIGLNSFEKKSSSIEEDREFSQILMNIKGVKTPFGMMEGQVGNEKYLISYSKLGSENIILANMIQEKKVLLIQDVFLNQVVLFLLLITSFSLLIGTLAARWLTWHLDQLTFAAKEMENENFDVHLEFEGKDELGTLGKAFNSMGEKIKYLLEELRIYNTELEKMVADRTKELQNLTDIQKAMLNSLGQGFVIIDKDHKIKPVYSKIATEMFEAIPDESAPAEILGLAPEESESFKELFEMAFNEVLDFEDMAKLTPDFRSNSKKQKIFLNYAPIKNGEEGNLEYVLVIGTDKTAELETMEKFKKEWNFSQMIMKIASNRFTLNKVISESFEMLKTALIALESNKEYGLREVQRLVHTIKGSFSYFYIDEITKLAHDCESFLSPYYDNKFCDEELKNIVFEKIMALEIAIECYIEFCDDIIHYKDAESTKTVALKDLEQFSSMLKNKYPQLGDEFRDKFFKIKVQPFFQMYTSIVKEIGLKLNKEVRFELHGGDTELPEGPWEELFHQFIHAVRNSIDHGLETASERESMGKPREGTVFFKFAVEEGYLQVELGDDGRGFDWHKLAKKDPSIQTEADAFERIKSGGLSSKDEVSDLSGRGVGVSSIFATVEKWGGNVEIINNLNIGMSFIIRIPLNKQREERLRLSA